MAITKTVINNGNQVIGSNNGRITIDQSNGEIIIRDGINKIVEIDSNGFSYYDRNGTRRISMGQDNNGLQQIIVDDSSGRASILIGQDPTDGSPILLVGKEGVDVINES